MAPVKQRATSKNNKIDKEGKKIAVSQTEEGCEKP